MSRVLICLLFLVACSDQADRYTSEVVCKDKAGFVVFKTVGRHLNSVWLSERRVFNNSTIDGSPTFYALNDGDVCRFRHFHYENDGKTEVDVLGQDISLDMAFRRP